MTAPRTGAGVSVLATRTFAGIHLILTRFIRASSGDQSGERLPHSAALNPHKRFQGLIGEWLGEPAASSAPPFLLPPMPGARPRRNSWARPRARWPRPDGGVDAAAATAARHPSDPDHLPVSGGAWCAGARWPAGASSASTISPGLITAIRSKSETRRASGVLGLGRQRDGP